MLFVVVYLLLVVLLVLMPVWLHYVCRPMLIGGVNEMTPHFMTLTDDEESGEEQDDLDRLVTYDN